MLCQSEKYRDSSERKVHDTSRRAILVRPTQSRNRSDHRAICFDRDHSGRTDAIACKSCLHRFANQRNRQCVSRDEKADQNASIVGRRAVNHKSAETLSNIVLLECRHTRHLPCTQSGRKTKEAMLRIRCRNSDVKLFRSITLTRIDSLVEPRLVR